MSARFIKMISEIHAERFNVRLGELVKNRTPCGIFFGFDFILNAVPANVQSLVNSRINVTCAVVVSVAQAEPLKSMVNVPVITLENIPNLDEGIKLDTIFIFGSLKDFALVPYFARYGIKTMQMSNEERFSFTMKHLPEIYSIYEMLGSDESKKIFCAAIKGNLTGKIDDYRFAPEPQYFLSDFMPSAGDIAIDGGAYDGSTALDFAKCGAKVHAFEMNEINYKNCLARFDISGGGHCN